MLLRCLTWGLPHVCQKCPALVPASNMCAWRIAVCMCLVVNGLPCCSRLLKLGALLAMPPRYLTCARLGHCLLQQLC